MKDSDLNDLLRELDIQKRHLIAQLRAVERMIEIIKRAGPDKSALAEEEKSSYNLLR